MGSPRIGGQSFLLSRPSPSSSFGNPLKRREIRRAGNMHHAKAQTFLCHLHDMTADFFVFLFKCLSLC